MFNDLENLTITFANLVNQCAVSVEEISAGLNRISKILSMTQQETPIAMHYEGECWSGPKTEAFPASPKAEEVLEILGLNFPENIFLEKIEPI